MQLDNLDPTNTTHILAYVSEQLLDGNLACITEVRTRGTDYYASRLLTALEDCIREGDLKTMLRQVAKDNDLRLPLILKKESSGS